MSDTVGRVLPRTTFWRFFFADQSREPVDIGANVATAGAPGRPPLSVVGIYRTTGVDSDPVSLLGVMSPEEAEEFGKALVRAAQSVQRKRVRP